MRIVPSVVVAGTGILGVGHISIETLGHIKAADAVFYLVADPVTEGFIQQNNPNSTSLQGCYREQAPRMEAYEAMVQTILAAMQQYDNVCALFYGHPGMFVYPSHELISRAKALGFDARMLPAISTEDCLFADLAVDPSRDGCQSYEATDFLIHERLFSPHSPLVLWQVGVIGDPTYRSAGYGIRNLDILVQRLVEHHPPTHRVVLYEAPHFVICPPRADWIPLAELPKAQVTAVTTLYVPASSRSRANLDTARKLGLSSSSAMPDRAPDCVTC